MLTTITVLAAIGVLVWGTRHIQISVAGRVLPPLSSESYAETESHTEADSTTNAADSSRRPRISVLVASKDEEANIEACARSWLTQDYPDFELILINDRSSDRTGEIIDSVARSDPRVRAIHVESLREGWFGKNNAMREGVEHATGEWLCFSDADCVMTSPRVLTVTLADAMAHSVEFYSLLPILAMGGIWERIVQPACGGVMMMWFNPLRANDPRSPVAYANGAYMLMSRAAYEQIGGHEPVKTEVNEDVHMARRAKEAGLPVRVVPNADLYTVRMYSNFGQAWRGWSRIFYGCFGTMRRLVLSLAALLLLSLLPWAALAASLAVIAIADAPAAGWRTLASFAGAASFLQLSVMFRFYHLSHVPARLAPTYPIGALLAVGMVINAMRRLGGRSTTTWRGTTYRGDQVVGRSTGG